MMVHPEQELQEEGDASRWSCSHCGPHPGSRQNWCAAGCGSDYNRMTRLRLSLSLDVSFWAPGTTREQALNKGGS